MYRLNLKRRHKKLITVLQLLFWPAAIIVLANTIPFLYVHDRGLFPYLIFIIQIACLFFISGVRFLAKKSAHRLEYADKAQGDTATGNKEYPGIAQTGAQPNNQNVENRPIEETKLKPKQKRFFTRLRYLIVSLYSRDTLVYLLWVAGFVLVVFLLRLIPYRLIGHFIIRYNFWFSLVITLSFLQFAIRRNILQKQTWKKMSDVWLKWTGVSGVTVGGFGFIAVNDDINKGLLKITTNPGFADIKFLTTIYIINIIIIGIASLLILLGKASSDSEDSNQPKRWFIPAFVFTWFSSLGLFTLFFDSILLTLHAQLTSK